MSLHIVGILFRNVGPLEAALQYFVCGRASQNVLCTSMSDTSLRCLLARPLVYIF